MVTDTVVMTIIWLLGNSPSLAPQSRNLGVRSSVPSIRRRINLMNAVHPPMMQVKAQDIPRASVPHVMRRHRAKTLGNFCSNWR